MRRVAWACGMLVLAACLAGGAVLRFQNPCQTPPTGPKDRGLRIVSLAPSVTEMLFILEVGPSVVGATDYCDYPPEAKRIERVGGFGKPSVEKLLAMAPDLVVAAGMERSEVLPLLRDSGVQTLDVKIHNIKEMFEALRRIGDAIGKRPRADDAIASMQTELERAVSPQDNARPGPPPRVFVELWDDPLTTAGRTSFLDDVIARAGGVNVAHELTEPHLRINPEQVIAWNPDVIVIAHMKRGAGTAAQIADRIGWSDMTAVKNGNVFCDIPTDLILRPGPRLVEGVKLLAQRLREAASRRAPATNKVDGRRP